eukprot:g49841.t1
MDTKRARSVGIGLASSHTQPTQLTSTRTVRAMGNSSSNGRRRSSIMRLSRAGAGTNNTPSRGKSSPEEAQRLRELDKYCKPQGLYPTCPWDARSIRTQILLGNLAPCHKGQEEGDEEEMEECPICLLFYAGGLNRATCCRHSICTECYLQVKDPKGGSSMCPFCQSHRFHAVYRGALTDEEKLERQVEQQKVIELITSKRNSEIRRDEEIADLVAKGMSLEEARRQVVPQEELCISPSPIDNPNEMEDALSAAGTTVTDPYEPYDELGGLYAGDDIEDAMLREAIRRSMLDTNMTDRKDSQTLLVHSSSGPDPSASTRDSKNSSVRSSYNEAGSTAQGGEGSGARTSDPATLTLPGPERTRRGSDPPGRSESNLSAASFGGSYSAASDISEEEDDEESMMAAAIQLSLSGQAAPQVPFAQEDCFSWLKVKKDFTLWMLQYRFYDL